MSRTAQKDAEFEAARKEAQRLAQQQRGASALAALGGGGGSTSTKPPTGSAHRKLDSMGSKVRVVVMMTRVMN